MLTRKEDIYASPFYKEGNVKAAREGKIKGRADMLSIGPDPGTVNMIPQQLPLPALGLTKTRPDNSQPYLSMDRMRQNQKKVSMKKLEESVSDTKRIA